MNLLPSKHRSHAGFLLEWQPFDWGQKRHRIEQLRTTAKEATLTTHRTPSSRFYSTVHASLPGNCWRPECCSILQLTAVQEAEREKLRVLMNRYQQKAALLRNDVLQQQSALAQADSQYQQAIASFWTARADFDRALGEEY